MGFFLVPFSWPFAACAVRARPVLRVKAVLPGEIPMQGDTHKLPPHKELIHLRRIATTPEVFLKSRPAPHSHVKILPRNRLDLTQACYESGSIPISGCRPKLNN